MGGERRIGRAGQVQLAFDAGAQPSAGYFEIGAEIQGEIYDRVEYTSFGSAGLASDHHHIVVERWRAAAAQLGAPAVHAQLSFQCNALFFVSERAVAAERYEQIG